MVREPLQGIANGSAVDDSGAYAAQGIPEVKAAQRFGVARAEPAQSNQDAADTQH